MAIKFLFEVEVEFLDIGPPSEQKDDALQAALSDIFEQDDAIFEFMPPLTELEGPISSMAGSVRLEFDDLKEAFDANIKIKEIIIQHGFSVVGV